MTTLLRSPRVRLFLASFLALYFEVLVIRYLSSEIRVFAYLKNVPLIASFFGIGLGMIFGKCPERLRKWFPVLFGMFFLPIFFSQLLMLDRVGFPDSAEYMVFGFETTVGLPTAVQMAIFIFVVAFSLALIVAMFVVFGGFVGEQLSQVSTLPGYAINLAGSLAGLCFFSLLSFWRTPPAIWLLVGWICLAPFFWDKKERLAGMLGVIVVLFLPFSNAIWSPYYSLRLYQVPVIAGWDKTSAIFLTVNHSYHQKMLDLSPEFLSRYPDAEPNRGAVLNYELPYRMVPSPEDVLIVGAGTGNDVAAAIRNGVQRIDAVEIDPVIWELGKKLHPERPYDSPRVHVHINDARAFFKTTDRKYDLIIFAYLDAHTLLSSFSSIRLDNYVYTVDSFHQAKSLLKPGGTLALAFDSGTAFVDQKMYATLQQAFDGVAPYAYRTQYDSNGVLYVEGGARSHRQIQGVEELSDKLAGRSVLIPTDRWPFLYLRIRTIPTGVLIALIALLLIVNRTLRKTVSLRSLKNSANLHFFLLGGGFLLLETRSVTEMSLLFGSTWLTNVVVIASFLLMAILANALVSVRPVPFTWAYAGLFATLLIGAFIPFSRLDGLPTFTKVLTAGVLAGLPVFFSGIVFSTAFRDAKLPAEALGINLFGAMLGGALENTVMIGGTPILVALAFLLYAGAAFAGIRSGREKPTDTTSHQPPAEVPSVLVNR